MTTEEFDMIRRKWSYRINTQTYEQGGAWRCVCFVTIETPFGEFSDEVGAYVEGQFPDAVFKAIKKTYQQAIDAFARTEEAVK